MLFALSHLRDSRKQFANAGQWQSMALRPVINDLQTLKEFKLMAQDVFKVLKDLELKPVGLDPTTTSSDYSRNRMPERHSRAASLPIWIQPRPA
jgi:hypothetical protein